MSLTSPRLQQQDGSTREAGCILRSNDACAWISQPVVGDLDFLRSLVGKVAGEPLLPELAPVQGPIARPLLLLEPILPGRRLPSAMTV